MDLVDPLAGEVHELLQVVLLAENLRLEPANLTGGSGVLVRQHSPAAHHMTHRRVDRQSLCIVDVLVARQAAVDGLPKQRHHLVLLVAALA